MTIEPKDPPLLAPAALAQAIVDAGFRATDIEVTAGDGKATVRLDLLAPSGAEAQALGQAIGNSELAQLLGGAEGRRAIGSLLSGTGTLNIALRVDRETGKLRGQVEILDADGGVAAPKPEGAGK